MAQNCQNYFLNRQFAITITEAKLTDEEVSVILIKNKTQKNEHR